MRVIVSKSIEDHFRNYVLTDSLKKALEFKGVEVLIINSFTENDFDAGVFISRFKSSGVSRFLYITSNPNATIQLLIKGVKGFWTSDEFYFDDEEELDALINDLSEEEQEEESDDFMAVAAPALDVVTDFMKSFVNGDKIINTPFYLERVNNSITELTEVMHRQELQLTTMGYGVLDTFERASKIIEGMNNQRKLIEKKLEELEYSTANTVSSKPSFGNNIMFFTPYKYIGNSKVCLFREYSPCRYLTSFILGYLNHLHYELNKRPKLIFVHQKGQGVSAKYSDYTAITQDSMNIASLYDAEIIATNNPKKEVLRDLLMKPNDVIIVVDRLYGAQDIVTGRIAGKVNAVGSKSDIKRYNIKPENTIFSVTSVPKNLFTISVVKNYPTEKDGRIAAYVQFMEKNYELLDKKFGI